MVINGAANEWILVSRDRQTETADTKIRRQGPGLRPSGTKATTPHHLRHKKGQGARARETTAEQNRIILQICVLQSCAISLSRATSRNGPGGPRRRGWFAKLTGRAYLRTKPGMRSSRDDATHTAGRFPMSNAPRRRAATGVAISSRFNPQCQRCMSQ